MGDFNSDGNLDLVVGCGGSSGKLDVFLGNGHGGFSAPLVYSVSNFPSSIAVADLNGDGKLDLAVTGNIQNNVNILLGNGNGTFQAAQTYATGTSPVSVAVCDFNNDGNLDLAVGNASNFTNNGSSVNILLGNGNGTFQTQHTFATAAALTSLAVGDFTGNGDLDLAVGYTDWVNSLSIFLGNGHAGFSSPVNYYAGIAVTAVAVADFNGDGKLDIAAAAASVGDLSTVSVLLGDGAGHFNAPNIVVGANPQSVAVGDFNGDGNLDLAVANEASNTVSILLGNGNGTFSSPSPIPLPSGADPTAIAAADFNGDGNMDLAVAGNGLLGVLLGNGNGTFAWSAISASDADGICVGYFDGSGYPDIAVSGPGGYAVLLNNGSAVFTRDPNEPAVAGDFSSIAAGDFTGNGHEDLALTEIDDNYVSILLGDGKGGFSSPTTFAVGANPTGVAVGDFNGDGKLDLAVCNATASSLSILLGNGDGTFQSQQTFTAGNNPQSVAVADFTGNGDLDIVTLGDGSVCLLLGNGAGGFGPPTYYVAGSGFNTALTADGIAIGAFVNNGGPDLAVANPAGNTVSVLLDQGFVSSFQISAPASATENGSFIVTVTALDPNGNTAVGYAGTVHFSSSDRQAELAADATLTNGTGLFSVTLNSAGSQTLTAADSVSGSVFGAEAISVTPTSATSLAIAAILSSATAGQSIILVVSAVGPTNFIATGFSDTIQFTSSDGQALLPANTTLTNGVGFFAVALRTAGTQFLSVTDTANNTLTATTSAIAVSPGAAESASPCRHRPAPSLAAP